MGQVNKMVELRKEFAESQYIYDSSYALELKECLSVYGENIKFEDMTWVCDKKKKSEVHNNECSNLL